MRPTTQVHAAIRNVGDSRDKGQFFEGPLRDAMLWIASQLGEVQMATRIQIGVARNRSDVEDAIQIKRSGSAQLTEDLAAMLESVLKDNDSDDEDQPEAARSELRESVDELDTYKG